MGDIGRWQTKEPMVGRVGLAKTTQDDLRPAAAEAVRESTAGANSRD